MSPEEIKLQQQIDALTRRVAVIEGGADVSIDMGVKDRSSLAALIQQRFGIYVGYIVSSGSVSFAPKGWTAVKDSTGQYTVTHNLGTTAYVVNANVTGSTNTRSCNSVAGANSFQINIGNAANSAGEDNSFIFLLTKV